MTEQEFTTNYEAAKLPVMRYAQKLASGKQDWAEDLAQAAWLDAWKGKEQFQARSSFATWVRTILHNCYRSYFRSPERTMQQQIPLHMPHPVITVHPKWNAKLEVESLLSHCQPRHARILRRRYLEDSLHCPLTNSEKLHLFRAKESFRSGRAA